MTLYRVVLKRGERQSMRYTTAQSTDQARVKVARPGWQIVSCDPVKHGV